jgi:negative regulator of flagellin synthesis FlgM
MDIRNSLDGLRTLLGVNDTAQTTTAGKSTVTTSGSALGADSATLSSAANEVSQTAGGDSVRMDKVASIQAMLAAGTYNVSPAAVASKLVDSMLANS